MNVLSFDCGLRNLGVAVVGVISGFQFLPEHKAYASPDEDKDAFKLRALLYFLRHGWHIQHVDLIDVSISLERPTPVKRIVDLSLMNKA